jgi:hypothetical protein
MDVAHDYPCNDPFWSLTIFTLDILGIYGLIAYGKKISGLEL